MDVHDDFKDMSQQQLEEAHQKDLEVEGQEGAHFLKAWADPQSGKAFCLSEAPSKEAVLRTHERAGHPTREIYEIAYETR